MIAGRAITDGYRSAQVGTFPQGALKLLPFFHFSNIFYYIFSFVSVE